MMKSFFKLLFLTFFISAIHAGWAAANPYVRVAITQDAQSPTLKIQGPYTITDSKGRLLASASFLNTTVTTYKNGLSLGERFFKSSWLSLKAGGVGAIVVDGRMFKGEICLIKNKNNSLTVINRIDLEDYVKGILYHEVSHYWPMEALRAQAVVSRTYALYQMQENKQNNFDVTSDIYSQVYGGKTSERFRTSCAVDETRGRMLTYQGKVFPTYFSATCAGHTEDASLLWNIDILPLKGVPCSFCKESPHYEWHYVLTLEEIEEKLRQAGFRTGRINGIKATGVDRSGRVKDLMMAGVDKETKISSKDFRMAVGPNIIRSTKFKVSIAGDDVVFEGFGWGHGVGLCQWGAYFMAKQGRTTEEILKYYYPHAEIAVY